LGGGGLKFGRTCKIGIDLGFVWIDRGGIRVHYILNRDYSLKKRRNSYHGVKYTPIHPNNFIFRQALRGFWN
jgi:hypothetical protein